MPHRRPDPTSIPPLLAPWYAREGRDLPWRHGRDPYAIWISEIMLQQTQVKTVIPYFENFLRRFPDPHTLASASEEEVTETWAGLGYYSRCRNLHRAAKQLVEESAGVFPDDPEKIAALPGIGNYTRAAIASIAFGIPLAVIDGNVERVLARYLGIDGDPRKGDARKDIARAAAAALDRSSPGDHNQAMMELGATVCTPRSPDCSRCPLEAHCYGRASGDPQRWPGVRKRRRTERQQWIAAVALNGESVLLTRRAEDAPFLAGHWGTPLIASEGVAPPSAGEAAAAAQELLLAETGVDSDLVEILPVVRHSITYRRLEVTPVLLRICSPLPETVRLIDRGSGSRLAALFRKVFEAAEGSRHTVLENLGNQRGSR